MGEIVTDVIVVMIPPVDGGELPAFCLIKRSYTLPAEDPGSHDLPPAQADGLRGPAGPYRHRAPGRADSGDLESDVRRNSSMLRRR